MPELGIDKQKRRIKEKKTDKRKAQSLEDAIDKFNMAVFEPLLGKEFSKLHPDRTKLRVVSRYIDPSCCPKCGYALTGDVGCICGKEIKERLQIW